MAWSDAEIKNGNYVKFRARMVADKFPVDHREVMGRDDQQGPALASYLAATRKPKVVAVIDDATAYGEGLANEVEKTLKEAKITVLPREKGDNKKTDWKAVLTKIRGDRKSVV